MTESAVPISRSPSVLMTALSLIAAGWIGSAVAGFWSGIHYAGPGIGVWVGYSALVSAVAGGFVLRALLPRLTGVEIAYGWAVVALAAGSFVGNLLTAALGSYTAGHASRAAPIIWSNPVIALGFTAISLLVSYWVIALTGHAPHTRPPVFASTRKPSTSSAWDTPDPGRPLHSDALSGELVRTEYAVAETCISISRAPARAIPGYITEAIVELATCANTLRASRPPDPRVRAAVSQLVDGLERFQRSLADIADDAAATGSSQIVQTGLLFPSLSDTSDGGGRARYELDHADGLATIRDAFDQLRTLGVLPAEP